MNRASPGEPPPAPISATPLVSVVTPCYNAAPFVGETIESVRAQTYPPLEHIVVDDASTDGSWDVIRRHADRITTERLPRNRGGSHARNRGAALAGGEFLLFLDADDLIAPDTVAALVSALRERREHVAVCRWSVLQQVRGRWAVRKSGVPFPPPSDPLRGWLEGVWVPPCAVLWRRDAFERAGGWDERITLNDDGDLMMRALARGVGLAVASAGHAYYRAHGAARLSVSTLAQRKDRLASLLLVLENLEAELERGELLGVYAVSLGVAYHRAALAGYQAGHAAFARECQRRGERYAGRVPVSPTQAGRLLSKLLGVEGKERLAGGLASLGLATPQRRRIRRLRALHDAPRPHGSTTEPAIRGELPCG